MSTNIYKQFLDLIPDPPRQVGEVASVSGGVATVELPGGGLVRALGSATVGDQVFVRDGLIEGQAPSLSIVLIDV